MYIDLFVGIRHDKYESDGRGMGFEGDLTAERRESVEVSRVALVIFDEESRFRDSGSK